MANFSVKEYSPSIKQNPNEISTESKTWKDNSTNKFVLENDCLEKMM